VKVTTQKLSHYVRDQNIAAIDFIHMDVQGAELMVLEGAGSFIQNIKAIWLEVENVALYKDQPTKTAIEDFMAKHHFVCVKSTVNEVAGDQFYINMDHFDGAVLRKIRTREEITRIKHQSKALAKRIVKKGLRLLVDDAVLVRLAGGSRMVVNQGMAWAFGGGAYYEKNVEFWLRRLAATSGDTVFYDIGANAGYYSIVVGRTSQRVYAFEPGKATRQQLTLNMYLNRRSNVHVVPYGLSDEETTAEFNIYSSSGNNSLFERDIPESHELKLVRKERVKLIDLDTLREREQFRPPTLIKIDIEGGELSALKGARKTLAKYKPLILLEYSAATSADAGYRREELIELLKPLGYRFYGLSEQVEDCALYDMAAETDRPAIDNVIAVPEDQVAGLHSVLTDKADQ